MNNIERQIERDKVSVETLVLIKLLTSKVDALTETVNSLTKGKKK